jgi:hypothetical protein
MSLPRRNEVSPRSIIYDWFRNSLNAADLWPDTRPAEAGHLFGVSVSTGTCLDHCAQ